MSIEIVVGESDARRACVEKLLRIEEAMKLLSPLVRAVPFRATGTEVEALLHDLTEALDAMKDATDASMDVLRRPRR